MQISVKYCDSYRNMIFVYSIYKYSIFIHFFFFFTSRNNGNLCQSVICLRSVSVSQDRDQPRKRMNTVSKNKNHICIIDIITQGKQNLHTGFYWLYIPTNYEHHGHFML